MTWLQNPNGSWATYNGTWVVLSDDNSCCCGVVLDCGCENITPLLNIGVRWEAAALPPDGAVCVDYDYPLLLEEQVGLPDGIDPCLGSINRWWKGEVFLACTTPTTWTIEFLCCTAPGSEFYARVNDGNWFQVNDDCNFDWVLTELADSGIADTSCTGTGTGGMTIYIWQDGSPDPRPPC